MANSCTNLPSFVSFNIPTISSSSCSRFPARQFHSTDIFCQKTEEEQKFPPIKSSKNKPPHANKPGSHSHEFKSKTTANILLEKPLAIPTTPISGSLAAVVCNAMDDFINNYLEKVPLRPWFDPRLVLAGKFAPVDKTTPVECLKVESNLPNCLNGVYICNGANPRYVPRSGYHLFDGDGMLHALTIKDGWATFCSRFVCTHKFVQEEMVGRPLMPNVFSGFYLLSVGLARVAILTVRVLLGLFNPFNGVGLANTSVIYFNHKLMVLVESDLPYVVKVTEHGDVKTIRRYGFDGKTQLMCMTAHPNINPDTGELFSFSSGPF